jgi:hypothetical protein
MYLLAAVLRRAPRQCDLNQLKVKFFSFSEMVIPATRLKEPHFICSIVISEASGWSFCRAIERTLGWKASYGSRS